MKLVKPSFEVLEATGIDLIERAGRTCYKSEEKITEDSAAKFVEMLDKRGHRAMLEHSFASVRVVCDRGVTHEIVRHRLFAYAQESTRYCDYSKDKFGKEVTFILPPWVDLDEGIYPISWGGEGCGLFGTVTEFPNQNSEKHSNLDEAARWWFWHCAIAERDYFKTLDHGWVAQQARAVLPNSLKTEIVISGNFREWQHFFTLRTATAAHPQMMEIAIPMCEEFERRYPAIKWREDGTAKD